VHLKLVTAKDPSGWTWFPWGVLRSAGFPIKLVEPLRSDALVLAADSFIASDHDVAQAAETLDDHATIIENRPQRWRIRRAVKSQRRIDEAMESLDFQKQVRNWNDLLERRSQAAHTFDRAYEQERFDSTARLHRVVQHDGIRRAMIWQNRRVIPFLEKAKDSWDERVLLSYIIRYATKNDTIGFFGPATWIRVSNEPGFGELHWGQAITRSMLLSFEWWPIAFIAERLTENERLRPWLSPRRAALCRLQNHKVFMPPDYQVDASDGDIEILQLCDGRRTAREIAAQLSLNDLAKFDELHRAGLITWSLECPMRRNPESTLEALAARIGDGEIRDLVEKHSSWLDGATARLQERADTSVSLATALAEIDSEFEQRYGKMAVQNSGQYYAGRTLTYIDCERDVSLRLNADLMNALMRGVQPILISLRWYTYTIVKQLIQPLAELVPYGEARSLAAVFPHALSLVWSTVQETAATYRQKWQNVLAINPLDQIVRIEAAELAATVATEFAAPHPGWPMARVHNPDILIGAESHTEFARGNCALVLGDVHASLPSMFQSAIFSLCPEPESVRDMFRSIVTPPPVINEVSQRLNLGEFFLDAAQLLLPDEPVTHFNARPIADFDLCHGKTGLRVRDVTTHQVWSIPAFFDAMLSRATFQIDPFDQPDAAHSPRIVVGDIIVGRERWRVTADTFKIADRRRADPGDPAKNFLAIRKWAREKGVPRHVFAKSFKEPKPIYLDLESQKCVQLFSHLLKRAAAGNAPGHITISEMIPEPRSCWLRDSKGDYYTSELRLLAVDPIPYPTDQEAS
jgi:hypothetical protein